MRLSEYAESAGYSKSHIRRVAEQHEIELSGTLSADTIAELDNALADHRERGLKHDVLEIADDIEREYHGNERSIERRFINPQLAKRVTR